MYLCSFHCLLCFICNDCLYVLLVQLYRNIMFTEGLDNSALRWVKEVCVYPFCCVCGVCIIYIYMSVCVYFVVDGFVKSWCRVFDFEFMM